MESLDGKVSTAMLSVARNKQSAIKMESKLSFIPLFPTFDHFETKQIKPCRRSIPMSNGRRENNSHLLKNCNLYESVNQASGTVISSASRLRGNIYTRLTNPKSGREQCIASLEGRTNSLAVINITAEV
jgi:hypothetical protein